MELGADMEARDVDGYKPVHAACANNAVDAVRALVVLGSTTIRDNHNWTPIMHVLNNASMPARKKAQMIQLIRKEME